MNQFLETEQKIKFNPFKFGIISIFAIMLFYQLAGVLLYTVFDFFISSEAVLLRSSAFIGQLVFMLIPTLILIKWQHGKIKTSIPFRIPTITEVFVTILLILTLQFVMEGFIYFEMKLPFPDFVKNIFDVIDKAFEGIYRQLIIANSIPELFYVLFVVALVPGICEEVLFRGLFLKNLLITKTTSDSIIFSGVIFALLHFNPIALLPLIFLGMYLGFLLIRTKSIFIPIIAHVTNNAVTTLKVYFNPELIKQNSTSFNTTDGNELSLIIVIVIASIIFYFLHKYFNKITSTISEN
ncbi:MAG: CPBP family intramembrane metalloprotease [Bacteroidetes bacterium]|nr:CPBP family intramembrane metalloprotease [Bacteroidota bacterium]